MGHTPASQQSGYSSLASCRAIKNVRNVTPANEPHIEIDSWVGGLCEYAYGKAIDRERFFAILTDQFTRRRTGAFV